MLVDILHTENIGYIHFAAVMMVMTDCRLRCHHQIEPLSQNVTKSCQASAGQQWSAFMQHVPKHRVFIHWYSQYFPNISQKKTNISQIFPKYFPKKTNISQIFPKYFPNISQIFPKKNKYFPNISQIFPKYFPNISQIFPKKKQIFPKYFPNISQIFPKKKQIFPKKKQIFPKYFPNISQIFPKYFPMKIPTSNSSSPDIDHQLWSIWAFQRGVPSRPSKQCHPRAGVPCLPASNEFFGGWNEIIYP